MRLGAAAFLFAIALAAGPASAQTLVYRVDKVTARSEGAVLVIVVKGAVRSGGWTQPRLILHKPAARDSGNFEIDFVATPPKNKKAVIQSVVPMNVRMTLRLPRGENAVRIHAESNSVTAPVVTKPPLQRTALY